MKHGKIETHYWPKPIPVRSYDWVAYDEDYEPGRPMGFGETKRQAIEDYEDKWLEWVEDQEAKEELQQLRRNK